MNLEENTEMKVGFISLSDIYPLINHPDSLAIPDLKDMKKEQIQYFMLNSEFRKRFLAGTKISETDKVFIYDYSTDVLHSFFVKHLNVVAYLNNYRSPDECCPYSSICDHCDQYDYRIGFEIKKQFLTGLSVSYENVLVYVGKGNPFERGQMKAIVWEKVNSNDFPLAKANHKIDSVYNISKIAARGNTYLYETNELQYFIKDFTHVIQDFTHANYYHVERRHLLIIDKKNSKVVVEELFYSSESSSPNELNFGIDREDFPAPEYENYKYQWTGKLFKNKPPVVFGFEWVAYQCPHITWIGSTKENIVINCDNRD
ncbi:MAG: hypothetical protein LBP63_07625 [Prevotellaceae bacterium]|nr:hypothetical protein [Prevotellaceae bacterium]